jgi:hypothetical protein
MKRYLLGVLAGAILATAPVNAAPVCVPDSLAAYIAQPDGCMIGAFTFKDFRWSQTGAVNLPSAGVSISPYADSSQLGLNYSSALFEVTGDQYLRYILEYTIDPPPPIIDSFDLSMDAFSPVAPGTATITVDLCAGDLFANSCANGSGAFLRVAHFGTSAILFDTVQFPTPVNMVDVRVTIELAANGASSQIDGFGQGPSNLLPDPVPEPGSLALGALGGLFLLARSRAFRSRWSLKR